VGASPSFDSGETEDAGKPPWPVAWAALLRAIGRH
jgi:hypothetical protein